ncbi:UDP-N-acetylglucosamine 1-carboxyvinyltransferase [Pelagirhabdus alkalitolerans]|uniref:UDP-N-acetylglucosamine 1-carboxyvinyltransferase n=1 Tax=Pelagirhabdus alkalitolerans TaxID=1612202 RepID=A0A1G6GHC2_9BACI|nr:UDP-N-acetylglucosamine 1-carboxyvinyltransferase [Pelagirhabdus alkalitolerans]SDB81401.1 UDP-N-acetylglucosamine 1-carboxyvinyltransferase [Pelagirhabdus alkalitolerans]
MEKIVIKGGQTLNGTVKVEGAKNAVLPVIAATLMASRGKSTIENVPALADVNTMVDVLTHIDADVEAHKNRLEVNAENPLLTEAPLEYVTKMRASVLVLGPLLARFGHAKVAMPGGCAIGSRPIDLHLKGFEAMGAKVIVGNGYVEVFKDEPLVGAKVYLDMASVGATENIMMAAALAKGKTIIENAAKEPEIVDLANFLNKMGAKVVGAGTETIKIYGADELVGATHSIIPDRIEAGTFMVAAALTKGNVLVEGAELEHLRALVAKMEEMGVTIEEEANGLRVMGPDVLKPADIKTLPHPGFPTDMQSQIMTLMQQAQGTSVITETVFENRFMHVEEFRRMNAKMVIEGRSVIVEGPVQLQGAQVQATDLRAGAALVLAGLVSDGYTRVTELKHIDRGYVDFTDKLKALGADVERIIEDEMEFAVVDQVEQISSL